MDFSLSEEQKRIQQVAYDFAIEELGPLAKECDREEKIPSKELVIKAGKAGLLGVFIPRKYGGPGLGFFGLALVAEQLSRVDMGLGMFAVLAPTFGSENILFFGSEEQKSEINRLEQGQLLFKKSFVLVIRHPLFLYILSDGIFVPMLPNTANEISIRPEFTSPKSFLYLWMTFEYLFGGDAFYYGYDLLYTQGIQPE